eukprot:5529265-Pleurochrysis_carterae.AAC.2
MRDVLGEASSKTINKRGRWECNVAEVYQRRVFVDRQLDMLTGMAGVTGVDLESMVDGLVQPATFR